MTAITPTCRFLDQCGNCTQMQTPIEEQSKSQRAWLKRALNLQQLDWIHSPESFSYRSRIRLRANNTGQLGYFKAKSHTHVPIQECVIAHESINDALRSLSPLPFKAKSVEFRSNGHKVVANITSLKGKRPTKAQMADWGKDHLDGIGLDGQPILGACKTVLTVCDIEHHLSLQSFYQVNLEINSILVNTVKNWVLEHNPSQVLDLYCGAGNIGAAIALEGTKVVGMDMAPSSIQDAKKTIKRHSLPMTVHQTNADKFEAGDEFFDVAILDPPRKGASGVISELQITRPKAILYVSCNPRALAKDMKEAKRFGYVPHRATAFDMFPHTLHVETLVELRKE